MGGGGCACACGAGAIGGGGACGGGGHGDDVEKNLGARLVKLLDFYGRGFDPRNMGISVARNRGEGEYIMRNNPSSVNRVDLSQLHVATQPGWAGLAGGATVAGRSVAPTFPYGARPRPASEAGDWCPPVEPHSPQQTPGHLHPLHQAGDWPLHRPIRAASTLATNRFRQHAAGGGVDGAWFDPLYVEDPLRPSNNVGRNCFRVYAIQQEFCKAHQLATMHPDEYTECEYPILQRLCKMLP